jgi:hypothetical protein
MAFLNILARITALRTEFEAFEKTIPKEVQVKLKENAAGPWNLDIDPQTATIYQTNKTGDIKQLAQIVANGSQGYGQRLEPIYTLKPHEWLSNDRSIYPVARDAQRIRLALLRSRTDPFASSSIISGIRTPTFVHVENHYAKLDILEANLRPPCNERSLQSLHHEVAETKRELRDFKKAIAKEEKQFRSLQRKSSKLEDNPWLAKYEQLESKRVSAIPSNATVKEKK